MASEGQDAKPHGDSSIKLEANVKGDSDASATTRQALESPLRGYSLLNGTSSPLLESVESITHNTVWRWLLPDVEYTEK